MVNHQRATEPDDGSVGVVPTPAWTNLWSYMSLEQRHRCFEDAAACNALSLNQMEQLLQDFPPETSAWSHPRAVLSEYEAAIRELRFDLAKGALVHPVSPDQFAIWCESHGYELREVFLERVRESRANGGAVEQKPPGSQTLGPNWAPLVSFRPPAPAQEETNKRKRGRPKTNLGRDEALVTAANEVLRHAAEAGKLMTREAVAAAMLGTAVAGRMKVATIRRRLSGKLRLEEANARAAQVQAKKCVDSNFRPFCL